MRMTIRAAGAGFGLLMLMVQPGPAHAQAPQERIAIESRRDSLAARTDTAALLRRERVLIDVARLSRDSTLLHLNLGFLSLRLGELTRRKTHFDDAASEFEWAAELEPDWPYAWYGLGMAELALGEHGVIAIENIRQILGRDYLSKAAQAFAHAAQVDPTFAQAVIDLARTAMRQRVRARLEIAQQALREAAATSAGGSATLQLARGRVEREAGEGDSALVAFGRYLALGGDSGVGLLERARTLFFLRRRDDAGADYYRAADATSGDARALLREDLAWIATPKELAAFDAIAPGATRAWLQAFWTGRDAEDGRRRGERLAEHYRRYFYARRHYRLVSRHRQYDVTERFRSDQAELDDRGIIYLRHGDPDRRVSYADPSVEPNESWQYLGPDRNLIFHFVARGDVADYKLVESLADAYGLPTAVALSAAGNSSFGAALFESRALLDPVYQRLGSPTGSANRGSALATERSRGRESLRIGTGTDSYPLHFERDLAPALLALAVGGPAPGQARLLVPFAVSGAMLTPATHPGGVAYPIAVRLALTDDTGAVRIIDTLRMFSTARPLAADQQLNGLMEVTLPPGRYRLRAVLAEADGKAGSVLARDSITVPDFGGGAVAVSDLLVGRPGAALEWTPGGDPVALSATSVYPAGSSVDLYYEVHGLARGERYRSRIEVIREGGGGFLGLFRGRRMPVSLSFEDIATLDPARVQQTVNLRSLKPGRYRLRVVVETGRDLSHTREMMITITE